MDLKAMLGRKIIRHINRVKYYFGNQYARYWQVYITPLVIERTEQLEKEIERLERAKRRVEKFMHPLHDYELNEALREMGYKTV